MSSLSDRLLNSRLSFEWINGAYCLAGRFSYHSLVVMTRVVHNYHAHPYWMSMLFCVGMVLLYNANVTTWTLAHKQHYISNAIKQPFHRDEISSWSIYRH